MKVRIWGCRGTLATPGPSTARYGGNTSCVEVRTDEGRLLVLDAGTGIRALGESLVGEKAVDLLLTHLHLDHLEGLGFFAPIYDADCRLTIWGPPGTRAGVETWLAPPFFPARVAAQVEFHEVQDESWDIAGLCVTCAVVPHPGPTLGYRLDGLAYIPDHEAARGAEAAIALAGRAEVLLHDTQYTVDEYARRVGWGHSSVADFAAVAAAADPGRAVMFHHDPSHDDATLDRMLDEATTALDREIEIAFDGLVL